MNKSMKETKPLAMPREMSEAMEKERRNQEAFAHRAKIAINLLPTLLKIDPSKSDEELVDRATSLAETFMDKLLGVKFEPTEETKE